MRFRRLAVSVALFAAVASALVGLIRLEASVVQARAVLPHYGPAPTFYLVDQDGDTVSNAALRGHIWVANFIFTRCAGQCPLMSSAMAELAGELRRIPSVQLVSFTVDPEWDTPEVLARYAKSYGASSRQWRFVTGQKPELERICTEGFRLSISDEPGSAKEPISHSVRLVLVDRAGVIRGYYDATEAEQLKRLRRDLRQLLHDES